MTGPGQNRSPLTLNPQKDKKKRKVAVISKSEARKEKNREKNKKTGEGYKRPFLLRAESLRDQRLKRKKKGVEKSVSRYPKQPTVRESSSHIEGVRPEYFCTLPFLCLGKSSSPPFKLRFFLSFLSSSPFGAETCVWGARSESTPRYDHLIRQLHHPNIQQRER